MNESSRRPAPFCHSVFMRRNFRGFITPRKGSNLSLIVFPINILFCGMYFWANRSKRRIGNGNESFGKRGGPAIVIRNPPGTVKCQACGSENGQLGFHICFKGNAESDLKDSSEDFLNRSVSFNYPPGFFCGHFSHFIGHIRTAVRVVFFYCSKQNSSDLLQRLIRFTSGGAAKAMGDLFSCLRLFCFVQRFLRYPNGVNNTALVNQGSWRSMRKIQRDRIDLNRSMA